MNPLVNSIYLRGNLGKDPQLAETQSGRKMLRMSLATSSFYKNKSGENVQNTQWHNLVAWGAKAELMEKLLRKGHQVVVFGKLKHRNYEDNEGKQRTISEVVVNEFLKLTKAEMPF